MKGLVSISLLLLISVAAFSQKTKYRLPERQTPVTNKQKLYAAKNINDISPLLWGSLEMPSAERYYLDKRRPEIFPQPQNYVYPQDNYLQILDVISVEITISHNGKLITAKGNTEKLTAEQKNLLGTADLGTDIIVAFNYKYKNQKPDSYGARNTVVYAKATISVVPDTEAEFPGGYTLLSDYFAGSVLNKAAQKDAELKLERAVVKFMVNENGDVINPTISRSSSDAKIDKLLLDALNNMPKWKPAVDANGLKVKQEICIPFSVGC